MQICLHPTRQQALTLSGNFPTMMLTLWSLATNPATRLTQRPVLMGGGYSQHAVLSVGGGITGAPDGSFFALAYQSSAPLYHYGSDRLELCHWHDLSTAYTLTAPGEEKITSLASSPDGRWLVTGSWSTGTPLPRLVLYDRLSGEVMSAHVVGGHNIVGLTFDATSTFVAGIVVTSGGIGRLVLWQLTPAERCLSEVGRRSIQDLEGLSLPSHSQDAVPGSMALTLLDWGLDWDTHLEWTHRHEIALNWGLDLVNFELMAGLAVFSPDSRIVIFSLNLSPKDSLLQAYKVSSGNRLWVTHHEGCGLSPFVLTPNGKALICSNAAADNDMGSKRSSDLLVYRMDDGTLIQRQPSGLSEPVEALLFDHDDTTLWLATRQALVRCQLPHELKTWMEKAC